MEEENKFPIELGEVMVAWEVDEYPNHDRSRVWYVLGAIIGVVLIVYAIATANFLFAVIILMSGIIMLLSTFQAPDKIEVAITTSGIMVGEAFFNYKDVKDFSIVYEPPEVKTLYFDFQKPWQPLVSIPLESNDPNQIRECLLPFCLENLERSEETLTDVVRRVYKL
ncbi:MAG: hypothetical protein UW63_C0092G0002 [Candidatus Uhrbacteria bacterium GW2011_GWF2_44_350]|uniref:DUF5673 domain-containing protein n=1 Tax=Candidatus Uhrbacteria bacterium GW2011_GWF2_44_350 TaxID=1619000 RepID=A0A0G1J8G6_9BACT|nr:MAG: hypothetical protein UW63_C0092G0002 [Candidatus Uhrbacteria bacterium GW2011_GWF2_44_350]HBR80651.1 hypothetical protein [Candidatus Uhrbacteria bacterium]